jgi:flagellar protein FlaJ
MFEGLKDNLKQEKEIVLEMRAIAVGVYDNPENHDIYLKALKSLAEHLDVLNNAVPELLKEKSPFVKKDDLVKKKKKVVNISYVSPSSNKKKFVTINEKDRAEFLKKLKLSEDSLSRVKKIEEKSTGMKERKPNRYVAFSNKYFREYSDKMSPKFGDISKDLKRANVHILLSSYLSMAIMSSLIAFSLGLILFIIMIIFSLSNWIFIVAPFGFTGLALSAFYFYPASTASSVHKNISYELPFATIHMAAIAGSNITPVKIFKIIAASTQYPNIGAEMKKVVVQIEIYGYDMVTSLKSVAKTTSNKRLSELFSGLATNISSGGALKNYLDKKSESFLVDYRLERQKYSALAGTFMDVYISILIAAPLVLMMMFIVMNVAGLGMGGLSINSMMVLAIGGVVIVNIIFMVVLNMKQPRV